MRSIRRWYRRQIYMGDMPEWYEWLAVVGIFVGMIGAASWCESETLINIPSMVMAGIGFAAAIIGLVAYKIIGEEE